MRAVHYGVAAVSGALVPASRALGAEYGVLEADLPLDLIGGPANAVALLASGFSASRMGGHWNRTVPVLLFACALIGAVASDCRLASQVFGSWCVLASSAMTGMLIVLPRPHSAPSAVVATCLLGIGLGAQVAIPCAGYERLASPWAVAGMAAGSSLFAVGAVASNWLGRSEHAQRYFVWAAVSVCVLCGAYLADRIA
jgi:hypothetical protein